MHEVRSPLESLGHIVYLTKIDYKDPEKVAEYMLLAEEQLANLTQIVSQTLSFARVTPEPRPSDLAHLTEAALRIHQRAMLGKGIRLVKEVPQNLVARVHTAEILQVISNLILNALDALPAYGTLRLRLRKGREHVHYLIADNGHGIPPEHLPKIFQPFFTTKEEQGNGLGLALSHKIVKRHGGTLSVRSSVRPGRTGTVFKISLPA